MLRVAEELMEVRRDCLAGPEREERSGTPEGAPMVEEEEGRGKEEEATGMGGPTQDEEWTEEGSAVNHDREANPIEAESFAILVNCLFWSRVENLEAHLFRRRSMGGRDAGGAWSGCRISPRDKNHCYTRESGGSTRGGELFRKGYVTTCTALSVKEQKRKKQARLARRGGNWAESKSGRTPESKRGRRPFGWDAVSRDGGRDNFFRGLERSEREEHETA